MSERDAVWIRAASGPMVGFVRQLWSARPTRPDVQRTYADARHGLSVDLGTGDAWLEPAAVGFLDVALAPGASQCGARLSIGAVRGLLGVEPGWGHTRLPLVDVAPDFRDVLDRMQADPPGAAAVLASWLRGRAARAPAPSPALVEAAHRLTRGTAAVRVDAVAAAVGCSVRQLQRSFRDEVGLSPKQVARIYRARRAREAIAADPQRALATIAAELGFADQAQMTKLFGRYCGATPGRYQRRKRAQVAAEGRPPRGAETAGAKRRG